LAPWPHSHSRRRRSLVAAGRARALVGRWAALTLSSPTGIRCRRPCSHTRWSLGHVRTLVIDGHSLPPAALTHSRLLDHLRSSSIYSWVTAPAHRAGQLPPALRARPIFPSHTSILSADYCRHT
jgi:hypothetical protein